MKLIALKCDEEDDFISLSSDDELSQAIRAVPDNISCMKLFVKEKEQPKEASDKEHPGVNCDGCDSPIKGVQYNCTVCFDFDLCSGCERKGIHPQDHELLCIKNPITSSEFLMRLPFGRGRGAGRQRSDPREDFHVYRGGFGNPRGGCGQSRGGSFTRGIGPRVGFGKLIRGFGGPEGFGNPQFDCEEETSDQKGHNVNQEQDFEMRLPFGRGDFGNPRGGCGQSRGGSFIRGRGPRVGFGEFNRGFGGSEGFGYPECDSFCEEETSDQKGQDVNQEQDFGMRLPFGRGKGAGRQRPDPREEFHVCRGGFGNPRGGCGQSRGGTFTRGRGPRVGFGEFDRGFGGSEGFGFGCRGGFGNPRGGCGQSKVDETNKSNQQPDFVIVDKNPVEMTAEEKYEQRLIEALQKMEAMGFDNDGNWLKQLLVAKDLSVERVLDALNPSK